MSKEDETDDEEDESEETLTPGDLMAFAWQISEGMVRLLLCCVTIFQQHIPCREWSVPDTKTKFPDFNLKRCSCSTFIQLSC